MAETTSIEWTDATWNPITGCSVISPGCTNCYAMRLAGTRMKHHHSRQGLTTPSKAGPVWNGRVRLNKMWLNQPIDWKRPRDIFVCAHSDLFQDAVSADWILDVFTVMAIADHHTYQALTKRPDRMAETLLGLGDFGFNYLDDVYTNWTTFSGGAREVQSWPAKHIWLGVSIEDQKRADERRPAMKALADAGWNTWVSYEPALGLVDWTGWEFAKQITAGGESGPNARPSHPDWYRATRDFCARHGIDFLFKQWGEWVETEDVICSPDESGHTLVDPHSDIAGAIFDPDRDAAISIDGRYFRNLLDLTPGNLYRQISRVGKKAAGRLLDGATHDARPGRRP